MGGVAKSHTSQKKEKNAKIKPNAGNAEKNIHLGITKCPSYLYESKILETKEIQKVSYKQAQKIVDNKTNGGTKTSAQVVRTVVAGNTTDTDNRLDKMLETSNKAWEKRLESLSAKVEANNGYWQQMWNENNYRWEQQLRDLASKFQEQLTNQMQTMVNQLRNQTMTSQTPPETNQSVFLNQEPKWNNNFSNASREYRDSMVTSQVHNQESTNQISDTDNSNGEETDAEAKMEITVEGEKRRRERKEEETTHKGTVHKTPSFIVRETQRNQKTKTIWRSQSMDNC